MLTGISGGLGTYFGISSTIIRIIFAFGIVGGLFGLGVPTVLTIVVYIVLMIAMPSKSKNIDLPNTSFNCDKPNCGYAFSLSQGDAYCRTCSKKLSDVISHN
jgi:phage shock protein PspC (stress-responsive transcriptional regulator)